MVKDYHIPARTDFPARFLRYKKRMEPDDTTKGALKELISAVQNSVDTSPIVKRAIENLQRMGYIPKFNLRMDVELLRPIDSLTDTRVRIA